MEGKQGFEKAAGVWKSTEFYARGTVIGGDTLLPRTTSGTILLISTPETQPQGVSTHSEPLGRSSI